MANFKLVAQLQINGPSNLNAVKSKINQQLKGISANINLKISPNATRGMNALNTAAGKLDKTLQSLTRTANNAVPAINNLAAALAANAQNIRTVSQATNGLQNNLQKSQKTVAQTADAMENLGKQAANAIKRYAAFSIAAGGIYELASAIKQGFHEAIDFQNEMVKLSQVTGASLKTLESLGSEVGRLSKNLGVSSKTLLNASQTLAQAGYTADEVRKGLEALAKTELAPTFKDIENTTEGAIAAMKQFDISINDLESTLGSMNSVAAQFAVESDDLVTAIRRSGAAFKASGGTLEEFIALFTSVRQTTRESAETIATGFRTIFTRIQRPKTIEYFKALGIELTDAKGNFIGAYEAVRRLSSAMSEIETTDPRFAKIVEELGGFRQVSKVIPLLQQFAVAEKALGVAMRGRTSLTKDAETAQDSLRVQLVKVKEEFLDLFRTIQNDSGFKSMVEVALNLTKAMIGIAKAATPLIPLLTGVFAIKAGSGFSSLTKGFAGAFGKKFARGGIVPGSGSGDTVPAMLTPGEFVVRKQAAQAIGYKNLKGMNRYAFGGLVKDPIQKDFGLLALHKGNMSDGQSISSISLGNIIGPEQAKSLGLSPKQLNTSENFSINKRVVYDKESAFTQGVPQRIGGLISDLSTRLAKKVGVKSVTPIPIDRIPNYKAIVGSLFEGAVAGLGNPYSDFGAEEFDDTRGFDFPLGVNFAPGLSNIPTDAKKSLTDDARESIRKKIVNFVREKYLQNILPQISTPKKSGPNTEGFLKAFASGSASPKDFGLGTDEAKLLLQSNNLDFQGRRGSKFTFLKKALGGSISGTDTVPAMLTPGEFVINKESAKAIGHGNLNRLNKVQKFAKGGSVGQIATTAAVLGPTILQSLGQADSQLAAFATTAAAATFALTGFGSDLKKGFGRIFSGITGGGVASKSGRLAAIGSGLSKVGAPLGIVAGLGGGFLQSNASKDIKNNQTQFAVGGLLSGAGQGAALGSLFGPIGIAVGAAAGAVYGWTQAVKESEKEIERLNFQESFSKLESSLASAASGKYTLGSQSGIISSELTKVRAAQFSTNPEQRKEAENRLAGLATNLDAVLSQLTADAKDLSAVENGFGKQLVETLAEINNVPVSEVTDRIKKEIDARQKSIINARKLEEASLKIENAFLTLQNQAFSIVESFRSASEAVEGLGVAFDSISSLVSGGAGISASSVNLQSAGIRDFGRTTDNTRLKAAIEPLSQSLGSQAEEFGNTVLNVSAGIKKLPSILESLSSQNLLNKDKFSDVLASQLNFGSEFKDVVIGGVESMLSKDQGEIDFFKELQSDPRGLAEKLTKDFEFLGKALEEASKMQESHLNNYAKRSASIAELELKIREEGVHQLELAFEEQKRFAEIAGKDLSSDVISANVNQRRNITSPGFTGPAGVGKQLSELAAKIAANEKIISSGQGNTTGLIDETNKLKSRFSALQSVLKDTATNMEKVSAISADIGKEREFRNFQTGQLDNFIFGGTEDRTKTLQNINATKFVAGGGDLQSVPEELRKNIQSLVESLPDDRRLGLLQGKTKKEFLDEQRTKALKAANVDDKDIESILKATPKEDQLQQKLTEAFAEMKSAQSEFQTFLGNQKGVLEASLKTQNDEFINQLKDFFNKEQKNNLDDRVSNLNTQKAQKERQQKSIDVINDIYKNNPERERLGLAKRYAGGAKEFESLTSDYQKFSKQRVDSRNFKLSDIISIDKLDEAAGGKYNDLYGIGSLDKKKINQTISNFDSQKLYDMGFNPGELKKFLIDEFEKGGRLTSLSDIRKNFDTYKTKNEIDKNSELAARKSNFESSTGASFDTYDLENAKRIGKHLEIISNETAESLTTSLQSIETALTNAKSRLEAINNTQPTSTNAKSRLEAINNTQPTHVFKRPKSTSNRARGGIVYANRGMFVPKGTDTVPAMLTPGEFVVNAKSAKQHRGLLNQINNTQYKANGGEIKKINGLWIATGGAKLSKEQQKQNLIFRKQQTREDRILDANINIGLNNLVKKDLTKLPTNEGILSQSKIKPKLKTQAQLDAAASIRNYANSNNPQLKELGRQRDIARAEKARNIDVDNIRSRTLAGIELIKKENKSVVPNINGVPFVSREEKNKQKELDLRMKTLQLNSENRLGGMSIATRGQKTIADLKREQEDFDLFRRQNFYSKGGNVDSVPAMLTPGEFVLNRSSVQRAGMKNLQRFNKGGPVGYYQNGGNVGGTTNIGFDMSAFSSAIQLFTNSSNSLISALNSFPRQLTMETTVKPVEIIINGAEALQSLQEPLQQLISDKINEGVNRLLKDKFPGAGVAGNVV